jgi:hypothetical protein
MSVSLSPSSDVSFSQRLAEAGQPQAEAVEAVEVDSRLHLGTVAGAPDAVAHEQVAELYDSPLNLRRNDRSQTALYVISVAFIQK